MDERQSKEQNRWTGHDGLGTVLGVWAHPDDEAYVSAGLMMRARADGERVVVVTATRGEAGVDVSAEPGRAPLATLREAELAASLDQVGVTEHHWLPYRDGGLADVPRSEGVEAVARHLAAVRPDTIVTFGPDGLTGHDDHRTISDWTTRAWFAAGRPGRLWYATLTPEFHQTWDALNTEVGLWFAGSTPPVVPASELAHTVRLTGRPARRKFAALAAHTSQTAELIRVAGPRRYERWWSEEYFVDAAWHLDRVAAA